MMNKCYIDANESWCMNDLYCFNNSFGNYPDTEVAICFIFSVLRLR